MVSGKREAGSGKRETGNGKREKRGKGEREKGKGCKGSPVILSEAKNLIVRHLQVKL